MINDLHDGGQAEPWQVTFYVPVGGEVPGGVPKLLDDGRSPSSARFSRLYDFV